MGRGNVGQRAGGWVLEILALYRFLIVGLAATAVHIATALTLVVVVETPAIAANLAGFALAFWLSFLGQYLWTFRSRRSWGSALLRFAVVSGLAFLTSNVALGIALLVGIEREDIAVVAAACLIPMASYLGNRLWAFS